ncbi:MAG: DMT family transporter [Microcoleaceae cyanobacterium]
MEVTNQSELPEQQLSKTEASMALISLLIANIGISLAPIFIVLSEHELSATATIFNRLWIATVVFGLWQGIQAVGRQFFKRPTPEVKAYTCRDLKLLLVVAIAFPLGQITWAWSMTQTSVAISALFHDLSPLFTTLGLWLLFAQRFDRQFLIGMIVAIGGVIFLGLEDAQISTGQLQGDSVALISAIFYPIYLIALEELRTKFSNSTMIFWVTASSLVIPLFVVLLSQDHRLFPSSRQGWLSVIALAICAQVVGQGLTSYSLKKLSSGFVALCSLIIPVLSALLAALIFSERLNLLSWFAFSVILFGLYLGISSQSGLKSDSVAKRLKEKI